VVGGGDDGGDGDGDGNDGQMVVVVLVEVGTRPYGLTSYHLPSVLLINSTHRGSDLEPMSLSRRCSQDTVSSTLETH